MKRFIIAFLLLTVTVSVIIPTQSLYVSSFTLYSGEISATENLETPSINSINSSVRNSLNLSSGHISTPIEVTNGPIWIAPYQGTLSGSLYTNPTVSITGSSGITGPIYRQTTTFEPTYYDYTSVPNNIPHYGDFSSSKGTTLRNSGRYTNFNLNAPLTIDTSKGDVFLIIQYMNLGNDIKIVGNHRAVIIIQNNINVNGHHTANSTKHPNFDFVVQCGYWNLQNNYEFYGNIYFEGTNLYIRNHIMITGAIYAPKAYIELQNATLYGKIQCDALYMQQNAKLQTIN